LHAPSNITSSVLKKLGKKESKKKKRNGSKHKKKQNGKKHSEQRELNVEKKKL